MGNSVGAVKMGEEFCGAGGGRVVIHMSAVLGGQEHLVALLVGEVCVVVLIGIVRVASLLSLELDSLRQSSHATANPHLPPLLSSFTTAGHTHIDPLLGLTHNLFFSHFSTSTHLSSNSSLFGLSLTPSRFIFIFTCHSLIPSCPAVVCRRLLGICTSQSPHFLSSTF